MARDDYTALLDACVRLGDASKGGDPQLWTEVLEYFGAQSWDCSQQVGLEAEPGRSFDKFNTSRLLVADSYVCSHQL